MALDFPASPVNGQIYDDYYYDAASTSWKALGSNNGLADRIQLVEKYSINAQTGTTYAVLPSDANKLVTMTNAAASTLTINASTAFLPGQKVDIVQLGAGQVTISFSGSTGYFTPGLKFRTQYSVVSIICISSGIYLAVGDLTI